MAISELLLNEFDEEVKKTRATLERVPEGKADFTPHAKSMTLGRLAPHVAELAGFGLSVLTTDGLDFAAGEYKPLPFESAAQLVRAFDEGAAKVRAALPADLGCRMVPELEAVIFRTDAVRGSAVRGLPSDVPEPHRPPSRATGRLLAAERCAATGNVRPVC